MNKFNYKNLTPFKWFVLENFPFIEADFDAITNWQLFCKLGEEINKVINKVNLCGEQVEELTNAFNNLQNYINNYFDNLDVQVEIDNKLNDMAISGELEEIIASYLNTKALICFDNVEDLKQSDNLVNGSYARTLGYYTKNDGGKAIYKIRTITNQDVINDMTIIPLNNNNSLIAELIENENINVNKLGIFGDNTTDVTTKLQFAIDTYNTIYLPNGIYKTSSPLQFKRNSQTLTGENRYLSKIYNENSNIIDCNAKFYLSINNIGLISNNHGNGRSAITNSGTRCARCNFEKLYIYNIAYGINLDSGYSDGLVIFDIKFETVDYCINLIHSEGATIKQLIAEPFVKNFIRIYQSNACEIANCIANGSENSMNEDEKILFIIYGSSISTGQKAGSGVHIHDIHAEFIHSIGIIAQPNTTLENIYLFNNNIQTNRHLIYIGYAGGVAPNNIYLNNIIKDLIDIGENYDIWCGSGSINLVDVYPVYLSLGNIYGLNSENWNPTIRSSDGENFKTQYNLKYDCFEISNGGRLIIKDTETPTLSIVNVANGKIFNRTSFLNNDLWIHTGGTTLLSKYNNGNWDNLI